MTAPKPNQIITLPIAQIVAIGPRGQLDEAKICELMESIKSTGLLKPIVVMRPEEVGCDTVRLVAGLHRLEASKRLDFSTIQCIVLEFKEALRIELEEIDEKIIRGDASAAERAILMGQRSEVEQELAAQLSQFATASKQALRRAGEKLGHHIAIVRDQAERTGESKDKLQRSKERWGILGSRLLYKIVGTTLDSGGELDALGQLPEAESRCLRRASNCKYAPKPKIEETQEKKALEEEQIDANWGSPIEGHRTRLSEGEEGPLLFEGTCTLSLALLFRGERMQWRRRRYFVIKNLRVAHEQLCRVWIRVIGSFRWPEQRLALPRSALWSSILDGSEVKNVSSP